MQDHQLWRSVWQDLADYIIPKRSAFTTKRQKGAKQTDKLFDSTALDASNRLASTMNGTLTSRAAKWFSLRMRDDALNEQRDVDVWLEDCANRMFRAYNQSNFAQEVSELYIDEICLGTGAIFEEERQPNGTEFNGLQFTALDLAHYAIGENAEGRVDTLVRTFTLSAAAIIRRWGKNKSGEKVNQAITDGKPEKEFTILHSIFPRDNSLPKLGTPSTKLPVASAYTNIDTKELIIESGFHEFPCMVPRWSKTSGEQYGRGPGFLALPDVKTLNKIKELVLKATGKAVDPPTKTLNEMIVGSIRSTGGGNTVVRGDIDNIKPLFEPGFFREIFNNDQIKSSELKASIEKIFYADQMQLPTGPAMTAFEVAKRFELLQRLLGPTMGRQECEFLNPLSRRTFGIMLRKGAFLDPPDVIKQQGAEIDVQYEGPLAKSQRLSEVEGIEQMTQVILQIAQIYPDAIDVIDWDAAIRTAADIRGVPAKVLRDQTQVKKIRTQKAAQQAQQQQLANIGAAAEAAGKAAPALQMITGTPTGAAA